MTTAEIINNIENGVYKPTMTCPTERLFKDDHIFDENQTVKWNREKALAENQRIRNAKETYRDEENRKNQQFRDDLLSVLQEEYGLSPACAAIVFSKAEDDGHWAGFHEVVSQAQILADFAVDILKTKETAV